MVSSYLQVRAAGFLSSQFGLACCCKSKSDWMATMETSNLPALQRSSGYRCFVLHQLKKVENGRIFLLFCYFTVLHTLIERQEQPEHIIFLYYCQLHFNPSCSIYRHYAHKIKVFMLTMWTSFTINPHWGGYMSLMAPFKGR